MNDHSRMSDNFYHTMFAILSLNYFGTLYKTVFMKDNYCTYFTKMLTSNNIKVQQYGKHIQIYELCRINITINHIFSLDKCSNIST